MVTNNIFAKNKEKPNSIKNRAFEAEAVRLLEEGIRDGMWGITHRLHSDHFLFWT